jgi:hypothetical protein
LSYHSSEDSRSRGGCLTALALLGLLAAGLFLFDRCSNREARAPDPEPSPRLWQAAAYVAGSRGGPYKLSWEDSSDSVHGSRRGVVGQGAQRYEIDVSNLLQRINYLTVEAYKTRDWEGALVVFLQANGKIVGCERTDEVEAKDFMGYPNAVASVNMNPGGADWYWRDWGCALGLRLR